MRSDALLAAAPLFSEKDSQVLFVGDPGQLDPFATCETSSRTPGGCRRWQPLSCRRRSIPSTPSPPVPRRLTASLPTAPHLTAQHRRTPSSPARPGRAGICWSFRLDTPAIGSARTIQSDSVRSRLEKRGLTGITVDTANRLQGREFDVTLVRHPRSGRQDASAFHLETGRLCASCSHATASPASSWPAPASPTSSTGIPAAARSSSTYHRSSRTGGGRTKSSWTTWRTKLVHSCRPLFSSPCT